MADKKEDNEMKTQKLNNCKEETMPTIQISKPYYLCLRCGHTWQGRSGATDYPRACPKCHSLRWDKAEKQEDGKA